MEIIQKPLTINHINVRRCLPVADRKGRRLLKNNLLRIMIMAIAFWAALLVVTAPLTAAEVFSDKVPDALDVYIAAGFSALSKWEWEQNNKDSSNPYLPAKFSLPMQASSLLASARLGLVFPSLGKMFAVEWEYNHLKAGFEDKDKAVSKVTGVSVSRNDKLSGKFLFANLLIRYPQGQFHPYLGAGIGTARISREAGLLSYSVDSSGMVFATQTLQELSYTAHPYQLFVGADYDITPNWALGLRYKFIKTGIEDPAVGNADMTFQGLLVDLKRTW